MSPRDEGGGSLVERRLPIASGVPRPPRAGRGWARELRASLRTADELSRALDLTPEEMEGARRAEREGLPIQVTPYYLSLCDRVDPRCPIRLQCIPHAAEAREAPGDLADPLGEVAHEVAPRLVQRYPDRALLLATDRCGVYCRFCTRSRMVGDGGGAASLEQLAPALAYLAQHPEVRDVIVSGGDPLTMATERLARLVARVRAIPSVETIRLATRVPVTLPSRVTSELVRALRPYHPIWVMTHFNHPKELTPAAERACRRFVDHGFPVNNQTVLLAGVNDDARILEALFRGLVRWRVRPYYLLQADPVRGTSHLRTPIATGVQIMEELQGRLSGIALPKLVVDTPGGMGKVPIGPDYVVARGPGRTVLRTHRGVEVEYLDPVVSSLPPRVVGVRRAPRGHAMSSCMAWVEAPGRSARAHDPRVYVRAPRPIDFPSEEPPEEHVSETKRHLEARTTLYLLLKGALPGVAIGSDQFVYWDAGDPRRCLSPDAFVKLGAREETFDVWKIWERGAPDLAVEIVSASDRSDGEWAVKLERYQASGIREVARFDPDAKQPLRVWDRVSGELLERSPESGVLRECAALGMWWVVAPSAYGPMLRLTRDRDGEDLVPTPSDELRRLAEALAEERKARTLAEHEHLLAERERAQEQRARELAERERAQERRARELTEDKLREAMAEIERMRAERGRG